MDALSINSPIHFTSGAMKALKQMMVSSNDTKDGLRVGVKNGGCAGFSYILAFDTKNETKDICFQIEGINIMIDKTHLVHLKGTEVDYQFGLNARGFTYTNPNAETTCGCGTSFG